MTTRLISPPKLEIFLIFANFLRSSVLSCFANRIPRLCSKTFHCWNIVKFQKYCDLGWRLTPFSKWPILIDYKNKDNKQQLHTNQVKKVIYPFFSKASHVLICVKLYFSHKPLPSSTSAMFFRDNNVPLFTKCSYFICNCSNSALENYFSQGDFLNF